MKTSKDSRDLHRASFDLRGSIGRPALVLGALLLLLVTMVAGCEAFSDFGGAETTSTTAAALAEATTTTEPATTTTKLATTTTTEPATTTTKLATTTTTTAVEATTTTGQVDTTTTTTTTAAVEDTTTTTVLEGLAGTTTTTVPADLTTSTTTTTLPPSTWAPFGSQTPSTDVLYEIDDWSAGISGWAAAGPWKATGGMLISDGSANSYTVAPVDLTGYPDYVVECEAQIVDPSAGTAVLLLARLINGTAYYGGFDCENSQMVVGYKTTELGSAGFVLDSEWHTYRLEVRGSSIKLFLEQAEVARAVDDRIEEAGTVGIYCGKGAINIRSFRVTAL